MKGTDLNPKKTRAIVRYAYIGALLLGVTSGVLYLYGYLWNKFEPGIRSSFAQGVFIESTETSCAADTECSDACVSVLQGTEKACMCLRSYCHAVANSPYFSKNKFCLEDVDCVASCYEGAVSKSYYNDAGGEVRDCSDGCARLAYDDADGSSNIVCRNYQCKFRNGQTCFIDRLKK